MPSARGERQRAAWVGKHQVYHSAYLAHEIRAARDWRPESTTDYAAMEDHDYDDLPNPLWSVLLCVCLGVGVHASKEALVPSEPALEQLGLGPLLYAALTLMPIALGILSPLLWGVLWDKNVRWVLIGAPIGELAGQTFVAAGLHVLKSGNAMLAGCCLVLGLLMSSACRAGITIAEFSIIGRITGVGRFFGFSALVLAKHGNGALISWAVPHVFVNAKEGVLAGLTYLQVLILSLHAIAVCAGVTLSHLHRRHAPYLPLGTTPSTTDVCSTPGDSRADSPNASPSPMRVSARVRAAALEAGGHGSVQPESALDSMTRVMLIGLWRALLVGTLHAYHSVRIELAASLGNLSILDAGALFATNDGIAMLLLPLLAVLSRFTGLHLLALVTPFISLAAITLFMFNASDEPFIGTILASDGGHTNSMSGQLNLAARAELLIMSILEVGAPVIPLALLPVSKRGASARGRLGSAYGIIETLFIACQICIIMLLGVVRNGSKTTDFHAPIAVMSCGFAAASTVSVTMYLLTPRSAEPATRDSSPPVARGVWSIAYSWVRSP